ncbi:serine/threonine-protein kinase pim-3-like isoform X2 [Oculina patagonica]
MMSEVNQRVSKKANLSGENTMNINPILNSEQRSRKRKAESDPLPMKRKRRENGEFLIKRRCNSSPNLLRQNVKYEGNKPQKICPQKNSGCAEVSPDHGETNWSTEVNPSSSGYYTPESSSYVKQQPSRKRKAKSDPFPSKRKRTENEDFLGERRCNSSSKLLSKPKINSWELSLGENESYLSGCYTPVSSCGSVADVKNTEPSDYMKELINNHAGFADYEIGKVLGAGSFGDVIAATRKSDNKPVALKFVLKSSVSELKKFRGRDVPAEAFLQRRVRHNHVIGIYQLIRLEEHYCYVMERPEACKDLFDIIADLHKEHKALSEKEVRRYFGQILDANIRCEERGVLHRDLKPENILVDLKTDEAKLIDFGLASEVQKEPFTTFRGTNQYMPPEYIKTRKYDGCQATVWQMGILLVDMLSPVVTAYEKPQHCLSMAPRIPPHLSPEAKHLITTLLNTTPENRPTLKQVKQHPWFAMSD